MLNNLLICGIVKSNAFVGSSGTNLGNSSADKAFNSKTELSELMIRRLPSNLHLTIEFFLVFRIISVKILELTVASPFFVESAETNSLIEMSISVDLISI